MDNHRGVFPIHRSVRFLLVTAIAGGPTDQIACRSDLDDPAELESIGDERPARWFPVHGCRRRCSSGSPAPTSRIPSLRSAADLAIVERAAALFPPLGSAAGWAVRFGRELNATDDRGSRSRTGGRPRSCRSSRASTSSRFTSRSARSATASAPPTRDGSCDPTATSVRVSAYRDVASATNRLTLIAAVLPARLRLHAHGVLPAHAASARTRSICSAVCSTASSSTTSCACA